MELETEIGTGEGWGLDINSSAPGPPQVSTAISCGEHGEVLVGHQVTHYSQRSGCYISRKQYLSESRHWRGCSHNSIPM